MATLLTGSIDRIHISHQTGGINAVFLRLSSAITFAALLSLAIPAGAQIAEVRPLLNSTAELRREQSEISATLSILPQWNPSSQQHGRIGFYGIPTQASFIIIDLDREVTPDEVILFPARVSPGSESEPTGFPLELEVELSNDASFMTFQRCGRWQETEPGEGARLPMLRLPVSGDVSGRYLRVRVFGSRLRPSGREDYYSFGEIVVLRGGENIALGKTVTASPSIENVPRWQRENLTDGYLWCLPFTGAEVSPGNGFHSGIGTRSSGAKKWVEIDLGIEQPIAEIRLFPAHPQDFADTAGFGFPPRFQVRAFRDSGEESLLYDSGVAPFPNPGAAAVMIPIPNPPVRRVRFESDDLWQRTGDYLIALAEIQIRGAGQNLALGQPVTASDEVETGSWKNKALTDGFSSRHDLLSWNEWLDGLSKRQALEKRQEVIASALEVRSTRNRQRWVSGLVGAVLLIAIAALLIVRRQRRQSIAAQDSLRRRIAADLHDELGASLSHLALQGELAASELDRETGAAHARLARLSDTARTTLDDMRDVIWLLGEGPGTWDEFANRLKTIAGRLLDGIDHDFQTYGKPPNGRPPIQWTREVVLFFKETLANARRYAAATKIKVTLDWNDGFLLVIEDNGTGFDPKTANHNRRRSGMGLGNLEQRATNLGGSATIVSKPDCGTTIQLQLPFPDSGSRVKPPSR